jgi:hypothetical protein
MVKTQEEYRQILEERLDENWRNIALTAAAAGVLGAGAGVASPHISNAKVAAMKSMGDPAGISQVETSRQGVRERMGLGADSSPVTRAGVGAAVGGALGGVAAAFGKKRRK